MPQEKRRSINYRSFVICDDPRGVVECQSLRKSNVISPQKREQPSNNNKIEGEKKQQNRKKSLAVLIEEDKKEASIEGGGGITRELGPPAPVFQLNNVTNSCSNGGKGHQKTTAKDLFRGALGFQESLALLNRLKEGQFRRLEAEKPCFSPRKSLDEMKKAVRESLLRQCVIANPVFEHNFDHRKQLGSPDMPSSSSSQSSVVYSSNFAPSDFSSVSSSSSLGKMGKGSSLIVKLMGLESFPSTPVKQRDQSEKILNLLKPMYDIVSPRARKPRIGTQELSLKQSSVDETLERLKSEGFLKSNTVNGLVPPLPCSELLPSENELVDGKSPIVVIKPLSSASLDMKEPNIPKVLGESGPGAKEMLIKQRPRRGPPQETVKGDAPNFSEKGRQLEGGMEFKEKGKPMKKVSSSKAKASLNLNQKTLKTQEAVEKVSELVKVNPNTRKGEEKKVSKSSHEVKSQNQARLTPLRIKKQRDGTLISKNQSLSQQKTASTTISDHKTRKTSKGSSQQEKDRQPVSIGDNQRSKGRSKEVEAANEEKVNATSQNDSVSTTVDSIIVENFSSEKQAEACHIQITEYDFEEQISLSGPQEDISMGANEGGNGYDLNDNQSSLFDITSASIPENGIAVHLNTLEEPTTHQPQNCHPSPSDVPSPSVREADSETSTKFLTHRTKLKALILSSQFVSQAEELFDLHVNPSSIPPVRDQEDHDVAYSKLLLDCATEITEFRSLQLSQACLPFPRSYKAHPRNGLSMDQLLELICNGIEDLKGYLTPATDILFSDSLYLLIDRDLRFKSGAWEIGWRNTFSQDEVEQVIGEVDSFVLGQLIEEVLVDFML